jgi:LPS-assembly protein
VPVYDTNQLTFGFGQLFRGNRFSSADRIADANQVAFALESRIVEDARGIERVRASIGQIFYFDDQRVQLPKAPVGTLSTSALIGEIDLAITSAWRAGFTTEWNPDSKRTDLGAVRLQHLFGDTGVWNLTYRFRRDLLEQVDTSLLWPINERWKAIGRFNYSLIERKPLETLVGFQYDSCCWSTRLISRRYVQNQLGTERSAIYFELELKGLGAIGRRSDELLRRSIAGYRAP